MTESANLTALTPNFITDASGGGWGLAPSLWLNKGNQVCHNGAVQSSTANVVLLLYCNHNVYHQNTSGSWFVYQSSGGWTATTDPRSKESPSGTTVTTIGPAIIDSFLESWTLVNTGSSRGVQVACNGVTDTITGSVVLLLYYNHLLYQQNSLGGWWSKSKSSDTWTATSDPRPATTTITGITLSNYSFAGGAASGTVIGSIGVTMSGGSFSGLLSLSGTSASSFQIVGNNLVTSGVVAAGFYSINVIATQAGATGSPFTQAFSLTATATTAPTITGITLGNSSFAGGAASGTVVGSIAVAMSGGTFSGSLSLTGTNASSFQIAGSNLVTNGVVAAGSYSVGIVATQAGATGSPFTKTFSITATSSSNWWTTPPPLAQAAGFTNLVFGDDFLTDTCQPRAGTVYVAGKNWYAWQDNLIKGTHYDVLTGTTAAAIANGNTSGGAFASPSGGLLEMIKDGPNQGINLMFQTVPDQNSNLGKSRGAWTHGYFECYLQVGVTSSTKFTGKYPAYWSWGANTDSQITEIDFMEFGNAWQGTTYLNMYSALHPHTSGAGGGNPYQAYPDGSRLSQEWHLFSMLWKGDGVTGTVQLYIDNKPMGQVYTTNSSGANTANFPFYEIHNTYLCLGTSYLDVTPVYVDYVRVWQ